MINTLWLVTIIFFTIYCSTIFVYGKENKRLRRITDKTIQSNKKYTERIQEIENDLLKVTQLKDQYAKIIKINSAMYQVVDEDKKIGNFYDLLTTGQYKINGYRFSERFGELWIDKPNDNGYSTHMDKQTFIEMHKSLLESLKE